MPENDRAERLWKLIMKKKTALLLAAICCFFFTSCSGQRQEAEGVGVIVSNFPLYDFARQIGGDLIQVNLLLDPGVESHSFEPTPQDIIAIQKADLFLYIGGESEAWVDSILDSSQKRNSLALMDSVELLEEEVTEGMGQGEHGHEHEKDEHIWTSPKNAIQMSRAICSALCQADPEHREEYQRNLAAYEEQLMALDQTFREIIQHAVRQKVVFGDRFPFRYFTEEYGLSYEAAFPGCAAQAEPSAATMAYLIDQVKTEQIPVIFYLELSNRKVADAIAEATGVKTALFHSCHNLSLQEFERGETYFSLMNQNAQRLKEALY